MCSRGGVGFDVLCSEGNKRRWARHRLSHPNFDSSPGVTSRSRPIMDMQVQRVTGYSFNNIFDGTVLFVSTYAPLVVFAHFIDLLPDTRPTFTHASCDFILGPFIRVIAIVFELEIGPHRQDVLRDRVYVVAHE